MQIVMKAVQEIDKITAFDVSCLHEDQFLSCLV